MSACKDPKNIGTVSLGIATASARIHAASDQLDAGYTDLIKALKLIEPGLRDLCETVIPGCTKHGALIFPDDVKEWPVTEYGKVALWIEANEQNRQRLEDAGITILANEEGTTGIDPTDPKFLDNLIKLAAEQTFMDRHEGKRPAGRADQVELKTITAEMEAILLGKEPARGAGRG